MQTKSGVRQLVDVKRHSLRQSCYILSDAEHTCHILKGGDYVFGEVLTHFLTNRKYIEFNCSTLFAFVYAREKLANICRPNELVFHQWSMLCSVHTLNEILHNNCLGTHVHLPKTQLIISVNEIYCPYVDRAMQFARLKQQGECYMLWFCVTQHLRFLWAVVDLLYP